MSYTRKQHAGGPPEGGDPRAVMRGGASAAVARPQKQSVSHHAARLAAGGVNAIFMLTLAGFAL